jgi:hypothetical protein
MFEQSTGKIEKDRSRQVIILSVAAVLIIIALMIIVGALVGSRRPAASQMAMAEAGSAEFHSYAPFVKITIVDRTTAENLLGQRFGQIRARVQNIGDKIIIGLRLRAIAYGFGDDGRQVLKDKIITPVPGTQRQELRPNETIPIEIQIPSIPDPNQIRDMTLELYALKTR